MELEQCIGAYARLRHELTQALAQRPGNEGKIDRLSADLITVERAIADLTAGDEQCGERLIG